MQVMAVFLARELSPGQRSVQLPVYDTAQRLPMHDMVRTPGKVIADVQMLREPIGVK